MFTHVDQVRGASEDAAKAFSKTTDELKHVSEQYLSGKMSIEEYNRAVRVIEDSKLPQKFKEQGEAVNETSDNLEENTSLVEILNERNKALSKTMDDTFSAMKDLASAYETLQEGGQLEIDQLFELIRLYPLVAEYIAATGDVSLNNGEILRAVAETKKEAVTKELELEQKKLEGEIKAAEARVEAARQEYELKAHIASQYFSAFQVISTQVEGEKLRQELDVYNKLQESLQNVEASIKAIEGVTIDNINAADNHKKALKEQSDALKAQEKAAKEAAKALEEHRKATIESINSLGDGLTTALSNMYKEMQKTAEESLDKELEQLKKNIDAKRDEYDRDYKNKIKSLNDMEKAELQSLKDALKYIDAEAADQIAGIQSQIDAIDNQTKEEDRALREQTYQKELAEKYKRLAAAETAEEIARITEEINEYIARRERELLLEQRNQEKDSLRQQIAEIRENANKRKEIENENIESVKERYAKERELAKEDYENKKKLLDEGYKDTQATIKKEMDSIKEHYAKLLSSENLQAEARKLMLEKNSGELVEILNKYNPEWQNAGQSLGESFVYGLNSTKTEMRAAIDEILSMIREVKAEQESINMDAPLPSDTGGTEPTPAESTFEYVVQWGDTLSAIAKRFNTTVSKIAELNNIADINRIFSGQTLKIPKFHEGGIFDTTREGLALLEQGEMILTRRQQSKMFEMFKGIGNMGGTGQNTSITINTEGLFRGAVLQVRDDMDIASISQKVIENLSEYLDGANRNRGLIFP